MIIFFIQKSQHTVTIDNSIYTEKIDDTETVIRGHKSMNRDNTMVKGKRISNVLQNITQKTKHRVTRTPIKNRG